MNNQATKLPTEIDAVVLGKKILKSFARKMLKEGKTEAQIREAFTLEKLNELTNDFCEKYNFKVIPSSQTPSAH